MTQETKHTPLPWSVGRSNQGKLPIERPPAIKQGENYLAILGGGSVFFRDAEANAQFIVKACNSHYELLGALEHCVNELERYKIMSMPYHEARQAIAKAEAN